MIGLDQQGATPKGAFKMTTHSPNRRRHGGGVVTLAFAAILFSGATDPANAQRPGGRANGRDAQGHADGPRGQQRRNLWH